MRDTAAQSDGSVQLGFVGLVALLVLWGGGACIAQSDVARPATQAIRTPQTEPGLRALWQQLADADAQSARQASWQMASLQGAAQFLGQMLLSDPSDDATIRRLAAELDDASPAVRQAAYQRLQGMDCLAKPQLEALLKTQLSAGASAQIVELLNDCHSKLWDTAIGRQRVRAVWDLELLAQTGGATELQKLANMDARHRVTGLAAAALARLGKRSPQAEDPGPRFRYEITLSSTQVRLDGDLQITARLINDGDVPAVVYWGDYAYGNMYAFSIKRADGTIMSAPNDRLVLPNGGQEERYFRELGPGQAISYEMYLGPQPGANVQYHYFRQPGRHTLSPTFDSIVTLAADRGTGRPRPVPGAWRGRLEAAPVDFTVQGDLKVLAEGVRISGRVTDENRQALAHAAVTVKKIVVGRPFGGFRLNGTPPAEIVERVTTDDAGEFQVLRLPVDSPSFVVDVTHPDYPDLELTIPADPTKKQLQADLVMRPGLTVRGTVVDSAGHRLQGAIIRRYDRVTIHETCSDETGRFILRGVPQDTTREGAVWVELVGKGLIPAEHHAAPELATGGMWIITAFSEREQGIPGRAVFADSTPVANLPLQFQLNSPTNAYVFAHAQTDGEGRFRAVPSQPITGTFSAQVQVMGPQKPGNNVLRDCWITTVDGLSPGQQEVRVVFENRLGIRALVKPANTLPTSFGFHVTCYLQGLLQGQSQAVATKDLPSTGGQVQFDRLCAGTYRVDLTAESGWNWSRQVTLGAQASQEPLDVEFTVPAIQFGRVVGQVADAAGKPASGRLWFGGSTSSGSRSLIDGTFKLDDVPVGQLYLEIRATGFARKDVKTVVRGGQTTDVGRVVLVSEDQALGWIEGRLLYDDGTPVLGAALVGDSFNKIPVATNGGFRLRRPAGNAILPFDLSCASGWPANAAARGDAGTNSSMQEVVIATAQVQAGQTVTRNITLPRSKLADLPLDIKANATTPVSFTVAVDFGDARLVRRWHDFKAQPGKTTVSNLPVGSGAVALSAPEIGYRGCQQISPEQFSSGLTFDISQVGTITVRSSVAGEPLTDAAAFYIQPAAMAWVYEPVEGLDSRYVPIGGPYVPSDKRVPDRRQNADGTMTFLGLGPGAYLITRRGDESSQRLNIEVQAGADTAVALPTNNDATSQPVLGR